MNISTTHDALDIFAEKGIRVLTDSEISSIAIHFKEEMLLGIKSNGSDPRGLKMYPTHVSPRKRQFTSSPDSKVLVVEIGGTNVYAAIVNVSSDRNGVEIAKGVDGTELYIKRPLKESINNQKKYKNVEEFLHEIVEKIEPLLQYNPVGLGIVYSFPAETKCTSYGIDSVSKKDLPKGFIIPDISTEVVIENEHEVIKERYIGESLLHVICTRHPHIGSSLPMVVVNDTVAVALSMRNANIGGIVGTGFNLAVVTKVDGTLQYLNTESGSSNAVPETELSKKFMFLYAAEAQISGGSLGDYINYAAEYLAHLDLIPHIVKKLTTKTIKDILQKDIVKTNEFFVTKLSRKESDIIYRIAKIIITRSAQITGTMIATMINTFPESFCEDIIHIPIEGSVFWRMPLYPQHVQSFAQQLLERKVIDFGDTEVTQAGTKGVGAAIFEMLLLEQK